MQTKAGTNSTAKTTKPKASTTKAKATKATKEVKDAEEEPKKTTSKKRKHDEVEEFKDEPAVKKRPAGLKKPGSVLNVAPTQKLNVLVFGEGSSGELGLGHMSGQGSGGKSVIDVKRPRLNPNLDAKKVGVVQISAGGMHLVALTHDNKILTWGVNDQGALGRSTKEGEQLKDIDEADDEDEEGNTGLNPLEAAPSEVDYINVPEGTVFTKVVAGDSITMVLTDQGLVYGCGTFRGNEGIIGFSKDVLVQETLAPIPKLKGITDIVCGANHVLALDKKGHVFAFGSGQQNQLGRRVVERTRLNGLVPQEFGLPKGKITSLAAGSYHSFAIDSSGQVWTWGLNSFGQCGIEDDAGTDNASILKPVRVPSLAKKEVTQLDGGSQSSLATSKSGRVYVWGRCDGAQSGIELDDIPEENFGKDQNGEVSRRLITTPTMLDEPRDVVQVCASSDHCLAITKEGKAYSWGFSENYQTGQGTTEDIETATQIENTAVKDQKLVWAGAGGQYGILAGLAEIPGDAVADRETEQAEKATVNGETKPKQAFIAEPDTEGTSALKGAQKAVGKAKKS